MKHNLKRIRKKRCDGYRQRYWIRRNYGLRFNEVSKKNFGSSKISDLMDKARKGEIVILLKSGGGHITMPPERELINKYIKYIKEEKDVPVVAEERRGQVSKGLIIKKNIDVEGGFIPKQIIMPGATTPVGESREFVNILAQERKAAKDHFKKYGTFEGWQKTYEQKKNIQTI